MHEIWHSVRKLILVYVLTYSVCYVVEGSIRLGHGVGSITAIERSTTDRGKRAKAIVARQKLIDGMNDDCVYRGYILTMVIALPVGIIFVFLHDIRLVNRLLARVWFPIRWFFLGFVGMSVGGVMLVLGPFVGAGHFYDRISPAEILGLLP